MLVIYKYINFKKDLALKTIYYQGLRPMDNWAERKVGTYPTQPTVDAQGILC